MSEIADKIFGFVDDKLGPSKKKHAPACSEDREMLMECVLESDCFKKYQNFKYCIQEGADKECKALRYDYHLCRRAQVYWQRSFVKDDR